MEQASNHHPATQRFGLIGCIAVFSNVWSRLISQRKASCDSRVIQPQSIHVNCYGLPVIAILAVLEALLRTDQTLLETSESHAKSENCLKITCALKRCYSLRWFWLCDPFCIFTCKGSNFALPRMHTRHTVTCFLRRTRVFSLRIKLSKMVKMANKISCRHNGASFLLCYGFWSSVMTYGMRWLMLWYDPNIGWHVWQVEGRGGRGGEMVWKVGEGTGNSDSPLTHWCLFHQQRREDSALETNN